VVSWQIAYIIFSCIQEVFSIKATSYKKRSINMTDSYKVSSEDLKQIIEKLERLSDDRALVSESMKEVMTQAKARGYDPKIIRMILKIRKMDSQELNEQEMLLDVYKKALGL
jgi:uncharacterized protein (UPF0335 family)